jgi:TRAP-type C4-dicarboxylate transport system substrate-binding protein
MRFVKTQSNAMRFVAAAAAGLCICLCMYTTSRGATTIKMGSLAPENSPWDNGLVSLAATWDSISNGSVTLRMYPGGVAGDEDDMIRKMRIGQLHAAAISGVGLSRLVPDIITVHLPLMVRSIDEAMYVLRRMQPSFDKELEKKGFKVLAWTPIGWVHFFSKQPVTAPAHLKEAKLFMYEGDPDAVRIYKEMGFSPVPLAITDLMPALQSGMVDAFSNTPVAAASYQWFGLAPHMFGVKWAPLVGCIVVSTRAWDRIPQQLHEPLVAAAHRTANELKDKTDALEDKAMSAMKQHGLQVHMPSEQEVAAWKDVTAQGIARMQGRSFSNESYERLITHIKAYRRDHPVQGVTIVE